MTTLMDPDDHRRYQRQYQGYVYMGYSDSRFQILEERQVRVVSFAGYTTFTFGLFGISVRIICLHFARSCRINHEVSAASARPGKVGG